ncbi:substrate-binding domain-containing protein [Corynebacterium macclintockiae]|uniref:substrate-binding domain-containing protein n=1 Tax=Corynebacterium macclintockiae TaxID=2913501 RepID=UPI003EC08BF6
MTIILMKRLIIGSMPEASALQNQQRTQKPTQHQQPRQRQRVNQQRHLKVVFSTGVQPDKWFRRFDERTPGWKVASAGTDDPLAYVRAGQADVALVRLPAEGYERPADMHEVALYEEQTGVAAPKDHPAKVMEAIDYSELVDEKLMYVTPANGWDDIAALREALQVVAANVGIAIAPRPLLRGINQGGVVHRDLFGIDATTCPRTRVALMWRVESDNDVIQDFVGICKGRTAGSSRQAASRGRGGVNKKAGRVQKTAKKKAVRTAKRR